MMNLNIEEISLEALGITDARIPINLIRGRLEKGEAIPDDFFTSLVFPPQIVAYEPEERDQRFYMLADRAKMKEFAEKLVALVKKELYEVICTESERYKKERETILKGTNINDVIAICSAGIVQYVSNSLIAAGFTGLLVSRITPIVTAFIMILAKMGKAIVCGLVKPAGEKK